MAENSRKTVTVPVYAPGETPPKTEAATRAERNRRRFATVFIVLILFLGFVGYIAVDLVTSTLLNEENYLTALAEHDAYNRIYTEVLADPELADVVDDLFASLNIGAGTSEQVYSFTVSTLRLLLPPDTLQAGLEGTISGVLNFVSGESPALQARLNISETVNQADFSERLLASVQQYTAILLAQAEAGLSTLTPEDIDLLNTQLDQFIGSLDEGTLDQLPIEVVALLGAADLTDEDREVLITDILSQIEPIVSPDELEQIEAALVAGDSVGAMVLLTGILLESTVETGLETLQAELGADGSIDTIAALAEQADETEESIVNLLNTVRGVVVLINQGLGGLLSFVMALCIAGLISLYRDNVIHALRVVGMSLFVVSGIVVILWTAAGVFISLPIVDLTAEGSALPEGLRALLEDVVLDIIGALWADLFATVFATTGIGLVCILLSFISLSDTLEDLNAKLRRTFTFAPENPAWIVVGVVLVVVFLPALLNLIFGDQSTVQAGEFTCNGHVELCDRPVNEVVFAATHNSMSISTRNWWWPAHDMDIPTQLQSGVRALLIDTHYWDDAANAEKYTQLLPEDVRGLVESKLQQVNVLFREGLYVCHGICTLGGDELTQTLVAINTFLDENPNEVIVIIIQDDITPDDTRIAFEDSGLIDRVFTFAGEWPTLRQMITSDERIIVMAEEQGPPPEWYLNVWEYTEETPFSFPNVDEYSCVPNRGDTDKPFFLLNHWVDKISPDRVDAVLSNEYDFLLERARTCADERGQVPNFIAVNFVSIGDTFAVVDTLNDVSP